MKSRRFFFREGPGESYAYQDRPTYILIGRWTHLYNVGGQEWMVVGDTPGYPEALKHSDNDIFYETTRETWRDAVGPWGTVELWEDYLGFRPVTRLAKIWRWFRPKKVSLLEQQTLRPAQIGGFVQKLGEDDDDGGSGETRQLRGGAPQKNPYGASSSGWSGTGPGGGHSGYSPVVGKD